MNSKKHVFENFKLLAITDLKSFEPDTLLKIEAAYAGGADIIQLRSKTLPDKDMIALGLMMRRLADKYEKLFFVNDRMDLALMTGADGVHLGQEDMSLAYARDICKKVGATLWIGKSTHSIDQALAAVQEGADYIGVGPIFATPTKPGRVPVGLDLIREVRKRVALPLVAIGGIDEDNLDQVLEAGATRIAVVRAVFASSNVFEAAESLRQHVEEFETKRGERQSR